MCLSRLPSTHLRFQGRGTSNVFFWKIDDFLLRRQWGGPTRMSEWIFAKFGNTRTDTDKCFDRRQIFDSIPVSRGYDARYAALRLSFSWRIRRLGISADFVRRVDHFRGNVYCTIVLLSAKGMDSWCCGRLRPLWLWHLFKVGALVCTIQPPYADRVNFR